MDLSAEKIKELYKWICGVNGSEYKDLYEWAGRICLSNEKDIAVSPNKEGTVDDCVRYLLLDVKTALSAHRLNEVVVKQAFFMKERCRYWFVYEKNREALYLFVYPFKELFRNSLINR